MRHKSCVAAALALMWVSWPALGRGQQPATAQADVDRPALAALDKMGAYLRTLNAFEIRSTTSLDEVLDNGQKIQRDGVVQLIVQRPNRFRAEITSDLQHRMFFYDGKSFTIWARRVNYYATVPAPATLGELDDALADKYDIELPLSDLFYWGSDKGKARMADVTGALDVGPSQVDGVSCEQYAFRQEGLDWQVWIQNGDFPLPRKLVLTTTSDEARPQYTNVITWNLAPAFNDAAFTFVPPSDAQKITIQQLPAGGR